MECPIDGTTLETHTIHSIEIEECPQCRGMWFEKGELNEAKAEANPNINWLDYDLWSEYEFFDADWSERTCPSCGQAMAAITYGDTGVAVEYCVEGHGVWLDQGEFQAIVDALDKEASAMDSADYARASFNEAKDILLVKEGFASDWKDFSTVTRMLQYRFLAENPRLAELLVALQESTPFK
jgi:Zn-finger nucleic acid-binding protein